MTRPTRQVYLASLTSYLRAHAGEDEWLAEGCPVSSKAKWLLKHFHLLTTKRRTKRRTK